MPSRRRPTHEVSDGPANSRLEIRYVAITDLFEDLNNARTHDERNLRAIGISLAEFGQVEPLLVQRGTGLVIGGNGRLRKLREQGAVEVAVVEVDADDTRARALSIALNRTGELADWDPQKLLEQLRDLQGEEQPIAAATGFSEADVDGLAERLTKALASSAPSNGETDGPTPHFEPGDQSDQGRLDQPGETECPDCGSIFVPTRLVRSRGR